MTLFTDLLAARDKDLIVVWDFTALQTRIATRVVDEVTNPGGWTMFAGAEAAVDGGSSLDVFAGTLNVGDSSFDLTDVDGSLTAWLTANDQTLARSLVTRREGFSGIHITGWKESFWLLEDYQISGEHGGGYRFRFTNALSSMSRGLISDFDEEAYQLDTEVGAADTTISLEKSPDGIWREPGFLLLWDPTKRIAELVAYTTISVGGDLTGLTRKLFGVGISGTAIWPIDETEVYHVWARRGDPLELALRMLLTNPTATVTGGDVNTIVDKITNGQLDIWPLTGWTAIEPGAATVTEETTIVRRGSAARLTGDGSSNHAELHQAVLNITPGSFYFLCFKFFSDAAGPGAMSYRIVKTTGTVKYWAMSGTWITSPVSWGIGIQPGEWGRVSEVVEIDPTFVATDDIRLEIRASGFAGGSIIVDVVRFRGEYDSEPNSTWDDGSGDGLGLPESYLDVAAIETLRDEELQPPTFDGNGDKLTGTAVLLVERSPIEDVKTFLEDAIFRAFALWPIVDDEERFKLARYSTTPDVINVDDEWNKGDFNPRRFRRELPRAINNLLLSTDYDSIGSEYGVSKNQTNEPSIVRYGKTKVRRFESRGGRTGLFQYPDYASDVDVQKTAKLYFQELAAPNGELELDLFYRWREIDLADALRLNVPIGNLIDGSPAPAEGLLYLVTTRKIDNAQGKITVRVRQRRTLSRAARVAPNTVAATYSGASEADRLTCYIAPDAAGFSDGSGPYTVI